MIRDLSVTPKAKNNNAKILMCVFFALSLVSLIVAMFISRYRGVVGMITLASLTTAILVYTKYVAVLFRYEIAADGYEEPLFIVRQTIGKKNATLCRVAAADISKIEKESAAERRAHKTPLGVARYVYTPTIAPSESYRIYVSSRHEKAEIILEISQEFADHLASVVSEAKLLRASSEDDE